VLVEIYIEKARLSRFFHAESFSKFTILLQKITMSQKNRKIIRSRENPVAYDIESGLPTAIVFSQSYKSADMRAVPVFTARINEEKHSKNYWCKHVRYDYLALEMVLDGELEFRTEDRCEVAGPGSLYLIPPGTTVGFSCRNGHEVRKLCAIIGGDNLKGILFTLKLADSRLLKLSDPESMAGKIWDLKDAVTSPITENSVRTFRFLIDLSGQLEENQFTRTPFSRAVAIMESNFQEDLQIPAIASHVGVSGNTLRRMFQQELHCSPLEYLNSVRMKFAVEKLRHTGLRIKEIAMMSGFPSPARFCNVFMEKFHVTPGEYREREQGKKAKYKSYPAYPG